MWHLEIKICDFVLLGMTHNWRWLQNCGYHGFTWFKGIIIMYSESFYLKDLTIWLQGEFFLSHKKGKTVWSHRDIVPQNCMGLRSVDCISGYPYDTLYGQVTTIWNIFVLDRDIQGISGSRTSYRHYHSFPYKVCSCTSQYLILKPCLEQARDLWSNITSDFLIEGNHVDGLQENSSI